MIEEDEYEARLETAVQKWVEKNPEDAHRLKLSVWGAKYLIQPPKPGGLTEMAMRVAFNEQVRKLNPKWPTPRAFAAR